MFIIIKMLSSMIGSDTANKVVDGLSNYLLGTQNNSDNTGNNTQIPGGQPLPEMGNPLSSILGNDNPLSSMFGNMDLSSLMGTVGSMLMNNNKNSQPIPVARDVGLSNVPKTPRHGPAYDE